MHFLVVGAAVPGLALLFLSEKSSGFRRMGGVSSLFSAAYIYGMTGALRFIESLGMLGFSLWLGSLVLLGASLAGELSIKGARMKAPAIACIIISAVSNAVFAFLFARAAGLGIV